MNQRIVLVGAVKFTRVVKVEVREPCVGFSFNDFVVPPWALLGSIAWLVLRTWIDTAGLVARTFTDAEWSAVGWRRMIAFSRLLRHSSSAWSRARPPIGPVAPAAVDGGREVLDVYALLILTPLEKNIKKLLELSRLIYLMTRAVSAWRSWSQQCCTSSIQRAPKLRTNLIQLRAHLQVLIGCVELQSTL